MVKYVLRRDPTKLGGCLRASIGEIKVYVLRRDPTKLGGCLRANIGEIKVYVLRRENNI